MREENELQFFEEYKALCKKYNLCIAADEEGVPDIYAMGESVEPQLSSPGEWPCISYVDLNAKPIEKDSNSIFNRLPSLDGFLRLIGNSASQKENILYGDLKKMAYQMEDEK